MSIQPYANLPVSVTRQQQIIDGVNAKLRINPRQSFIFTGKPGSGKTFLMRAIRDRVLYLKHRKEPKEWGKINVGELITLLEWHNANANNATRSEDRKELVYSPEYIRKICRSPGHSLSIFIDEIDCGTTTDPRRDNWQTFLNAIYENTAREGQGNVSDCVQAVFAMNQTLDEYKVSHGAHAYRRLEESFVLIDFNKEGEI